MKHNYISLYDLPKLSHLMAQRISLVNSLIKNLKIADVKNDEKFEQVTKEIKNSILFVPVEFGNIELVDYNYEEKTLKITQQFGNFSKDNYSYELSISFTGTKELLNHTGDSFSFQSSDHGIIEPVGKEIKVYVELSELNPEKAKIEAEQLLRLTKDIASKNSETVVQWNVAVEQKIDNDLEKQRDDLFRIFGKE